MTPTRRTIVYGPAYLDRVLRIDRPLLDPAFGLTVDRSINRLEAREGPETAPLHLVDRNGGIVQVVLPAGWPGPWGSVWMDDRLAEDQALWLREVRGVAWLDDLGGMGAGLAKALGGELVSALGSGDDPTTAVIAGLLEREAIAHHPIRVPDQPSDWTLLVTSGAHGDKLAIGFRGCHAAIRSLNDGIDAKPADLAVVTGLPNVLAGEAFGRHPGAVRMLAPAMRNMTDRDRPLWTLARSIDILSCNRREWHALPHRDHLADRVPLLAITDGPRGCRLSFRSPEGRTELDIPAFPRDSPPIDTNRAGESFAATLVTTLLDGGWRPSEPLPTDLARNAAVLASAAAALVIDRENFGFPTRKEIEDVLQVGRVSRQGSTSCDPGFR